MSYMDILFCDFPGCSKEIGKRNGRLCEEHSEARKQIRTLAQCREEAAKIGEESAVELRKVLGAVTDPMERARLSYALEEMFQSLSETCGDVFWEAAQKAYPTKCDPLAHFQAENES